LPKLPRLRIKPPSPGATEDIFDLEQARYRFNWGHETFLIVVEGQPVSSYEALVELVQQDRFRKNEFLEVELHPILAGG
jgi:hypothetical protein